MLIITMSNHTRIGAWVTRKMYQVGVYCTISLIAMHGYRTNTEYTGSLGYNSVYRKIGTHLDLLSLLHYIQDRMGVTEGDF